MQYVMSDIHGNLERFTSVMRQIHLTKEDTLYVLGDVIDRWPDGVLILKKLMKMPNVKMLLGNHEYMMLSTFNARNESDYMDCCSLWFQNGGEVTMDALALCEKEDRLAMLEFIEALPLNLEVTANGQDYLLVHGAPESWYRPDLSKYRSRTEHAVWQRITPMDTAPEGKILIFGHTPTARYQADSPMRIWHGNRMIGIDCGASYDDFGRLACLRLDDRKEFYSET